MIQQGKGGTEMIRYKCHNCLGVFFFFVFSFFHDLTQSLSFHFLIQLNVSGLFFRDSFSIFFRKFIAFSLSFCHEKRKLLQIFFKEPFKKSQWQTQGRGWRPAPVAVQNRFRWRKLKIMIWRGRGWLINQFFVLFQSYLVFIPLLSF